MPCVCQTNEIILYVFWIERRYIFGISTFMWWVWTSRNWLNRRWTFNQIERVLSGERNAAWSQSSALMKFSVNSIIFLGEHGVFSSLVGTVNAHSAHRALRSLNKFVHYAWRIWKSSFFIRFDYICMIYWLHFRNMRRNRQLTGLHRAAILMLLNPSIPLLAAGVMWFVDKHIVCV